MFPGLMPNRRNLPQHPAQRKLLIVWCWLYMSMGLASAGLGTLVLINTKLFVGGKTIPLDRDIVSIALILIVFGALRVAGSVFHIRRLSRMR